MIEKELQTKLLEFLETADLVKFAKFEPLASEHIKYLEQAYDFVLKTKIEVVPEQEGLTLKMMRVVNQINELNYKILTII